MSRARPWWVAQFVVAAIALAITIANAVVVAQYGSWSIGLIPSISGSVTAGFILPGLALSLVVNGVILMRRTSRLISKRERVALIIEGVTLVLVLAASVAEVFADVSIETPDGGIYPDPQYGIFRMALFVAIVLWPVLISMAVVVFVFALTDGRRATADPDAVAGAPVAEAPVRRWWVAHLVLAAILMAASLWFWISSSVTDWRWTTAAEVGIRAVAPGLALSLVINAFILRRHGGRMSRAGLVLLIAELGIVAVLVVIGVLDVRARVDDVSTPMSALLGNIYLGLPLWFALIVVAVVSSFVGARRTTRAR